jgi:cephalosporin hydroxylase
MALAYLALGSARYRELAVNADLVGRARWLSAKIANAGDVRDSFHMLSYYSGALQHTYWLGVPILKSPLDSWIYQEIIAETRPDLIIETGTALGGSALFFASMCDLVGNGRVVSIDVEARSEVHHPRLTLLKGDSTSAGMISKVTELASGTTRRMVVLDSDHSAAHVSRELRAYRDFVSPGSYLVVEDTNVNGHPVMPEHGPGPFEAVADFLKENPDFTVDGSREQKFLVTYFPNGYLRRRSSAVDSDDGNAAR